MMKQSYAVFCAALLLFVVPAGSGFAAAETKAGPRAHVVVGTDDRQPSFDRSVGRLRKERKGTYSFCTATLVSPRCALTAGHCVIVSEVLEFDLEIVPNHFTWAKPENLFHVNTKGIVRINEGKGRDWAVLPLLPNRVTKRIAGDGRAPYALALDSAVVGQNVVMTGYGAADNHYSFSQQTSGGNVTGVELIAEDNGYLEHDVDSGNCSSGSAVRDQATGAIVAIHTHGDSDRLVNSGTLVAGNLGLIQAVADCEARVATFETAALLPPRR